MKHKTYAKLDLGREEVDSLALVQVRLDKRRGRDALLTAEGAKESMRELRGGVSHRQCRAAGTVLGLDDLITTELDPVDERVVVALTAHEILALLALGEKRNDGDARVSTNNSNIGVLGVGVLDRGEEARSTDDVEGSDAVQLLGVERPSLLKHGGDNGHSRVDRVWNAIYQFRIRFMGRTGTHSK